MPRQPRSALPPSGVYHVTTRGVARCAISVDDVDRRRWRSLLYETIRARAWRCLAWCLMPNHFHLLVVCDLDDLSLGMHRLNFQYAQRFNSRHERVGHLFQDRFFTRVVRDEAHLESAAAYVYANPVRAALCDPDEVWPWRGGLGV